MSKDKKGQSKIIEPRTLKGFRDLLPKDVAIKQEVIEILKQVFESFGFQPLETPTLEYASTLLNKYGEEADKLVYTFKDKGARKIGLRYDLTVPVCKVMAIYQNQIPLPFKRYQIQNVFRAEKPQRGRFREFTQCDIDTFGVWSPLADAEIIQVVYTCLKAIGFKEFTININSRQILFEILEKAKITDSVQQKLVLQSIDKLDKKPRSEVEQELATKNLKKQDIERLFKAIDNAKTNEELSLIFDYLKSNQIPEQFYRFSPFMVRGLDYYTRTVFETYVGQPKVGSITGGGRYDKLTAQLGGPDLTGTGTTIGLERIVEVIKEFDLWPELTTVSTQVLVIIFSPELKETSIKTVSELRKAGITAELYLEPNDKISKQLKYADQKGIPYTIIIGPDEIKKKTVVLKDLAKRSQQELTLKEAISLLTQQL
ncbi:MAG: histidine--tRNA ligase [Patescibacteria group bacterium]